MKTLVLFFVTVVLCYSQTDLEKRLTELRESDIDTFFIEIINISTTEEKDIKNAVMYIKNNLQYGTLYNDDGSFFAFIAFCDIEYNEYLKNLRNTCEELIDGQVYYNKENNFYLNRISDVYNKPTFIIF